MTLEKIMWNLLSSAWTHLDIERAESALDAIISDHAAVDRLSFEDEHAIISIANHLSCVRLNACTAKVIASIREIYANSRKSKNAHYRWRCVKAA